jgi:hypothetical protein
MFQKVKKSETASPALKLFLTLMHAADQESGLRNLHVERLSHFINKWRVKFVELITKCKKHAFAVTAVIILITLSAIIRFHHAMTHLYFGASDPYVHLKWAKFLGANKIYVDGVYPFGFEAIISAMDKLFQLDPYITLRFLGPMSGVILAFSIYYVIRKHRPQEYLIAIFALLIYFISSYQFTYIWRQYSSLSMEYGVIFILPGICFFLDYLKSQKKQTLLLSIECFVLTIFIHPYAAVCLFLSYVVLFVFAFNQFHIKELSKMVGGFALAGVIGVLPLVFGILSGKNFHSESLRFAKESLGTSEVVSNFSISDITGNNFHIVAFLIISIIVLLFSIKSKLNEEKDPLLAYSYIGLVLFLFYKGNLFGLPALMLPYRIEVIMVLITSISIASLLAVLPRMKWMKVWCVLFIGSYVFLSYKTIPSLALQKGSKQQYNEAVEVYLKIKDEADFADWTIVSTIEEYPLTINYGWHYNLTDFIANISTGKEMKFASKDVFIYVEKVPLGTYVNIQNVGRTELNLPEVEESLDFYRDPKLRTILEKKVWSYIHILEEKKPDIVKVYFDSPRFRVYRITQNPLNPYDFMKLIK